MNLTHRRNCYGVFVISREIARRVQKEWEAVENPVRRGPSSSPSVPLPIPPMPTEPREKRPLAA